MISFLTGEIRNIFPEKSIVEINVSGIGYEVSLPTFVMDEVINRAKKMVKKSI
tara:strand:- start:149 stop:307 length:159 start_codon:yes stop_codon:yes gene_type:complete